MSDTAQQSPDTVGAPPGKTGGDGFGGLLSRAGRVFLRQREASVVAIAVIIAIYFAVSTTGFASHGSIVNIAQYMAPYTIIAIGEVFLMVAGEIDLSNGYVWMFSPFVMHFFSDSGLPIVLAIIVTIAVLALVVGLINGIVVTYFGVPSLVATLGTGWIIYGYALTVSHAQQINLPTVSPHVMNWFGAGNWSEFIWATILTLIFALIFTRTRWGVYTISVGDNLLGSREAGIKVRLVKTSGFILSAGLGATAGILEAFRNDIIDPSAGQLPVVLVALAGVVIGGTAMTGGSGTVIGAWLGVVVLGILEDGFNLRGISSNTFLIIQGIALVVMMILNNQLVKLRSLGRLGTR
ncbi:MAG: ABC transporter permease [Streptosporangiaceae bacterium]